jgi:hypothetical protein
MKLPKADLDATEWQTAIACPIGAAEGPDFLMHARIGVLRALNRDGIHGSESHIGFAGPPP